MIDELYDKISVKLKYNEKNFGSGVLYQPDTKEYSYLITARHCIFGEESTDEKVDFKKLKLFRQINGIMLELGLHANDIVICKEYDMMVFKLEYCDEIPTYQITNISREDKIHIVGFPNGLADTDCKFHRYNLSGSVNALPSNSSIQIDCDRRIETGASDAYDTMASYSGSGIFEENDEQIYLCGVITELGSTNGTFDLLNGSRINVLQDNFANASWITLISMENSSFDIYKDRVKEIIDNPMFRICSAQISTIKEHVTPQNIIEHCGKKLVWPYSNRNIKMENVWEGWLLYLMFRSIEDKSNLVNEKFYLVYEENKNRKVKLIYAANTNKLPDFLKDYLQNAYEDVNDRDFVIINTDRPPSKKSMQANEIQRIVTNVSKVIYEDGHIIIDEVEKPKKISLIHIEKIVDELQNFIEKLDIENINIKELERGLGKRIGEILHEF